MELEKGCDEKDKCKKWDCSKIHYLADGIIRKMAGDDKYINLEEEFDSKHSKYITKECDFNDDGYLDEYEICKCFENAEEDYRKENCPK